MKMGDKGMKKRWCHWIVSGMEKCNKELLPSDGERIVRAIGCVRAKPPSLCAVCAIAATCSHPRATRWQSSHWSACPGPCYQPMKQLERLGYVAKLHLCITSGNPTVSPLSSVDCARNQDVPAPREVESNVEGAESGLNSVCISD